MKTALLLGVLLLLVFSSVLAQPVPPSGLTVTVDVTTEQVTVLMRELPRVNERERVDELPFTLETWLATELTRRVDSLVREGRRGDRADFCDRLAAMPEATRRTFLRDVGGLSPCG